MIALEIQALSERRENLLIEIGRVVLAQGFTLQRQRLADDPHGVLLTMVVRGPERKQRALAAAMDAQERIISYQISAFEEGVQKPHFAATRRIAYQPVAPVTEPPVEPTAVEAPAPAVETIDAAEESEVLTAVELSTEPDYAQAMAADIPLAVVPAPAPEPTAPPIEPFVELILLGPDVAAVDKMLPKLLSDYPDIFPRLRKLEDSVAEAARASSLLLAGQRLSSNATTARASGSDCWRRSSASACRHSGCWCRSINRPSSCISTTALSAARAVNPVACFSAASWKVCWGRPCSRTRSRYFPSAVASLAQASAFWRFLIEPSPGMNTSPAAGHRRLCRAAFWRLSARSKTKLRKRSSHYTRLPRNCHMA
jgi:hypothetical protein